MAARRNLEVVVSVRNAAANKKLKNTQRTIRDTGKAARDAGANFKDFNRTLFATTAFVGIFVKSFQALTSSLNQGSQFDRLSIQFERVLGPKGEMFKNISAFTDASIDKMEAMRSGIALANLGIVKNAGQVAQVVSQAGVAAKQAGLDSSEGIKRYTEFLKTGSIDQLKFLNVLAPSNMALQTQLAAIQKAGGTFGKVIGLMHRLQMGQAALAAATEGGLMGQRDMRDIMLDTAQNFKILMATVGRFLGTALGPMIDKFATLMDAMSTGLEDIIKNDKSFMKLAKTVIVTTGAITALVATLGTLRLLTMALGSIGLGIPGLALGVVALMTAFRGVEDPVQSVIDKLKVLGGFVKGIFQLVTSLDKDTGIALIDEDIKAMLEENGIFVLAQNIARGISVIQTVIGDALDAFTAMRDFLSETFGGMIDSTVKFFDQFSDPWSNFWINDSLTPVEKFVRGAKVAFAGLVGFLAAKGLLKLVGGGLSKLPVVGKFFGGQPKGTRSDPMYVRSVDGFGTGGGFFGGKGKGPTGKGGGALGRVGGAFRKGGIGGGLKALGRSMGLQGIVGAAQRGGFRGGVTAAGKGISGFFSKGAGTASQFFTKGGMLSRVGGKLGLLGLGLGAASTASTFMDDTATTGDKAGAVGGLGGSIAGGLLGAKLGALAGSIVPGLGTAIGAGVGGLGGSVLGGFLGEEGIKSLFGDDEEKTDKRTDAVVPKIPETDLDKIDAIGNEMKTVDFERQKRMQASVEGALSSGSAGGQNITPDEYTMAMLQALDRAKLTKLMEEIQTVKDLVDPTSRRNNTPLGGR